MYEFPTLPMTRSNWFATVLVSLSAVFLPGMESLAASAWARISGGSRTPVKQQHC